MIKLEQIALSIEESEEKLLSIAKKKLHSCTEIQILKKSLDAREKDNIKWIYTILADDKKIILPKKEYPKVKRQPESFVIIGTGPAGLFCGLKAIECGIKPIFIERGGDVENRESAYQKFIESKVLDMDNNIQFGEGGAGTFSDGKLNTQTKSEFHQEILQTFIQFGAPKEILYLNKPHIGSDILKNVLYNIRQYILAHGGTMIFHTKLVDIILHNQQLKEICLQEKQSGVIYKEKVSELVLAIGHSSRDTVKMLMQHKLAMEPRDFAIGFRIEHLQEEIDKAQYGKQYKLLPHADYKLVSHKGERSVFTFCMCPGGYVMPATSIREGVVTNGMSNYKRDAINSNSGLMAQVKISDYYTGNLLDGYNYLEYFEKKAYAMTGRYQAPVQKVGDFFKNRESTRFGEVTSSYECGTAFCNLNEFLPKNLTESLKAGLLDMDKKLKGFANDDALLTAVESRFSSPVRILRKASGESENIEGIYPCGEGCGYSGGIMSSAVDGIKTALKIVEKYL